MLVSILSLPAAAEDWPQFRGPGGQGLSAETGLPISWTASENVAWKTAIPGKGWSSPIVWAGRVYLTSAVAAAGDAAPEKGAAEKEVAEKEATGQSLRALALDAVSGEILWTVEVFAQKASGSIHKKNSHASATPVTDGERLFVHFGTHGTAALSLDGKVLWRNQDLDYSPVHGNGGSPALAGDILVVSCDGAASPFVVALEKKSGKVRWKTERAPSEGKLFAFSTPLVIEVGGRMEVVAPGANWVAGYDPQDGREVWRAWHGGYSVVPRPVFGHGLIFVSSSFDEASLFAIRAGGEGDVSETRVAWESKESAPHTPTPVLVGDELYFVSDRGIASCVDARTGERHWRERLGGNHSASPFHAEGRIYFQSEEGEGIVIARGKEFRELARNPLDEPTLASPAVSGGAIFIRTAERLYRIQAGRRIENRGRIENTEERGNQKNAAGSD